MTDRIKATPLDEDGNPKGEPFTFEAVSMELTFTEVNPELIDLVTGGTAEPITSLEVYAPIKRTFWQWLRRKPRQYRVVYIPSVRRIK